MKIEIKNVGPIKSAEIELNGLTIITGLNDTGKSFVGKSLFSIIKAASEGEVQYQRWKDEKIEKDRDFLLLLFNALSIQLRNVPNLDNVKKEFNNILNDYQKTSHNPERIDTIYINKLKQYLEDLIHLVNEASSIHPQLLSLINNAISRLDKISDNLQIDLKKEAKVKYASAWNMLIGSVFQGNICNQLTSEDAMIFISENNNAFSVEIKNNNAVGIKIPDMPLNIRDSTYIESPIILQYTGFFIRGAAFSRSEDRSPSFLEEFYITRDLLQKLTKVSLDDYGLFTEENPIVKNIAKIIGGDIVFNSDMNDFEFRKEGIEKNITGFNIASGVKAFGILQRLIKGGFISINSILIIDEPEVHLHPEWQMKYARVIVELVKSGVPILINTHSPSMLQALLTLARLEELEESLVKVYFGTAKDKAGATFTDVTEDLEQVFSAMSYPVQKIYLEGINLP